MGMVSHSKAVRLAISGYYGFRNSGDEAVLRAILRALTSEGDKQGIRIEPVVLSGDPDETSRTHGVEAAHRMRPRELWRVLRSCDGLISGGGSLLQDVTSAKTIPYYTGVMRLARLLGKPVFVYAQGIGPILRGWMKPIVRSAMASSAYISVRDGESAALLESIGVAGNRIETVSDPVMGLPLPEHAPLLQKEAGGKALLGVSLRRWREDGADLRRAADALIALSQHKQVRLRFLPFHLPSDKAVSEQMLAMLDGRLGQGSVAELVDPGADPQQMLLEVSRCDALFGMRLHSLIYAANRQVPLAGLSYDPKIDHFLNGLGLQAVGTTEELDPERFVGEISRLLDEGEDWKLRHNAQISLFMQQSQRPAQQIVGLLRQYMSR